MSAAIDTIAPATRPCQQRPPLDAAFTPRSVALIGATDRPASVGLTLAQNLCHAAFTGVVHLVNPTRATVLGRTTWPSIEAVPSAVDLAVIATPAATVPDIVGQCACSGVRAAVILSAGFGECGDEGVALAKRVLDSRGHMRLIARTASAWPCHQSA